MVSKHSPATLIAILMVLLSIVSSGGGQSGNNMRPPGESQTPIARLVTEPAGANRCKFCHRSEVEGYERSAMAHSLRRAGQEPDGTVDTPDAKITMYSSPTGYWQRLQSGGDVTDYRVDYVIGSGNHASGYLVDLADHLFQSPVAYYKSRHAYDLAPGYEGLANPDFTRPVVEECVFCHSGTALHITGTSNRYRSPAFSEEAITCERCHGPAEKHLSDPRAGTIINPEKLDPAARNSICEQCHLLGVLRVLSPGKMFSDFRPGQRTEDIFTTYCDALPPGAEVGKFKVISHVEQLARSTCARMSNGQLWCGTCHNPHSEPLEPVQFYRSKCLSCHVGNFASSHPPKDSDCIGCHMPRRNAKDGGHTAFTDHRIQRRPELQTDLPKDTDLVAWREPASDLKKRNLGIAYVAVGLQRGSAPFLVRGYKLLAEVQNQFSTDSDFFTSIGTALVLTKQRSEAEVAFERALQLNPDSVTGERNAASAYFQAGDLDRAVAHLERGVALDPLNLPADAALIELYKRQGNTSKAEKLSNKIKAATDPHPVPNKATETTSAGSSSQTAETAFKNIQVLKGVPSDQLIPAMQFMASSLGVECGYCHVQDHFENDDKKPKQIARDMIRMMLTIDKDGFEYNREVTCYSCHRGSTKPATSPMPGSRLLPEVELTRSPTDESELPINLPSPNQVIDGYVQALGGAAAIEKLSSLQENGTSTIGGKLIAIDVYQQAPDKRAVIQHMPAGDSITVFNGHAGWSSMSGHSSRELHGADLDFARMDADLHFPLHIKREFAELRMEYPEKIGDGNAYVLVGIREGQPPLRLYFDEHSGLLVRVLRYTESPLGRDPTQIDYSDYRDADGVKIPFRWRIAQPDVSSTIQLERIQWNIPISDAQFTKARER